MDSGSCGRPSRLIGLGRRPTTPAPVVVHGRGPLSGSRPGLTPGGGRGRMVRYMGRLRLEGEHMAITASEARKNLLPLIAQVNDDREPIEITSKNGDAVLMSRADYE